MTSEIIVYSCSLLNVTFLVALQWHFETNASRLEECPSLAPDGSTGAVNHLMDAVSNGSSDEGSHQTISERCQDALYDVITSEKFALLCKLLLENFQGLKDDNLFGLNLMNARMKEEAYESSPQLFYLDIQKVLPFSCYIPKFILHVSS